MPSQIVAPFGRPAGAMDPSTLSTITRGNDNIIVGALNALPLQAVTTTAGVTTGAVAISAEIANNAVAFVAGDSGSAAFVDLVAWNGGGSAHAVSSTTTKGSPAARTYSLSSGALTLAMASGTYTITIAPIVFTT